MLELWRDIPGIPHYQASNRGRLRSVARTVQCGPAPGTREIPEQILTPFLSKATGYSQIKVRGKKISAHRLVALAWCDGYFNGAVVDHINGDRRDNRPENLEWVTQGENNARAFRNGRLKVYEGSFSDDHPKSKAVISTCITTGETRLWKSAMDAVRSGFDSSCISRCCAGLSANHKGYTWRFAVGVNA